MPTILKMVQIVAALIFLHASSAQAMSLTTIANCAKGFFLATAQRSGTKWMVRLARLTNQGTIRALDGDYQKQCVRQYADVLNDSRADLLMKVIKNGDEEGVEFLLDPKECLKCFQGTEQDPTLLHVALRMKQYHAARVLLDIGMDPNRTGKAAFSDQVRPLVVEFARNFDAVLLLIDYDVDLTWQDDEQRSIYSELFDYGSWDVICFLHDKGVKLSCGDYAVALEHKAELFEYELTSFIQQLKIKRPPFRRELENETVPLSGAEGLQEGLSTGRPSKRQLKEVMFFLNSLPRKEKLAVSREILRSETSTMKTETEKE